MEGVIRRQVPFFAVTNSIASLGFEFGSAPPPNFCQGLESRNPFGRSLHFDAMAISLEKSEFFALLFASAVPLSCLILDHRLWPDCTIDDVENRRHSEQMKSPLRGKERSPLENTAIVLGKYCKGDTGSKKHGFWSQPSKINLPEVSPPTYCCPYSMRSLSYFPIRLQHSRFSNLL